MNSPLQFGRALIALLAITSLGYTSLPCLLVCSGGAEETDSGAIVEQHCACSHEGEIANSLLALPVGQTSTGTGCACVSSRTPWQGQSLISYRVKDQQGSVSVGFFSSFHYSSDFPAPSSGSGVFARRNTPAPDQGLISLRTVVLLT